MNHAKRKLDGVAVLQIAINLAFAVIILAALALAIVIPIVALSQ